MQSWPRPDVPVLPGRGQQLRLFDTATASVLEVAVGTTASLYVCGITPYDATHLGHAATYLAFDLAQRVWLDAGKDVRYIQNVTDIDDPLIERAAQTGEDWQELAEREIALFRADMTALRVLPPAEYAGAVENIPSIALAVGQLLECRAAYRVDTDVYYRVDADAAFGSESGLTRPQMLALFAERGGDPEREGKQDPLDSLLWRGERPGEPSWPSALGPGRPGWHIECSYIALSRIGMGFDVQGGGSDLAFPHHEHSAAHARSLTGQQTFARAYVHAGMIGLDGEKMSKSRGNLVFVSKLRGAGVDPMAIRLALLDGHYRADREWTGGRLPAAEARLARWRAAAAGPAPDATALLGDVRAALADDLDSAAAIAAVDAWVAKALDRSAEALDREPAALDREPEALDRDPAALDRGDVAAPGQGAEVTAQVAAQAAGGLVRDLVDALLGVAL